MRAFHYQHETGHKDDDYPQAAGELRDEDHDENENGDRRSDQIYGETCPATGTQTNSTIPLLQPVLHHARLRKAE